MRHATGGTTTNRSREGDTMLDATRMRGAAATVLAGLFLTITACDILDVEAPSRVDADNLRDPANASLLVESAMNDFNCALSHYIGASGFIGTELQAAANIGGSSYVFYDQRVFTPDGFGAMYATGSCAGNAPNVYQPLSTARWQADNALERLQEWSDSEVPNRARLMATAAAYGGYSYTLLGEGMCRAAFDREAPLEPDAIFRRAEERFTTAIEMASQADASEIENMARVGRARALLNLGEYSAALDDAEQVPVGFVRTASYSGVDPSTENRVYTMNRRDLLASVEAPYRNMTFEGEDDPRVQVTDLGVVGPGSEVDIWAAEKYSGIDSPIPVATWEEAALIEAEAALQANDDTDRAVQIINTLHDRAGLPDFQSSDAQEIMDQIIYERRAELFLEGHHLMDMKRYDLPLDPPPGEPFRFGGLYGDQTCFPLPAVEYRNNPNASGS